MQQPEVTLELAVEHGLTEEEYNKIIKILDRVPTFTELGILDRKSTRLNSGHIPLSRMPSSA